MFSYEPLFKTLEDKGMSISDLRGILTSDTVAKFRKNEPVTLRTIEKICAFLQVPIEKVVEIKYDEY